MSKPGNAVVGSDTSDPAPTPNGVSKDYGVVADDISIGMLEPPFQQT